MFTYRNILTLLRGDIRFMHDYFPISACDWNFDEYRIGIIIENIIYVVNSYY